MLLTWFKLSFVIKIFALSIIEWPFKTCLFYCACFVLFRGMYVLKILIKNAGYVEVIVWFVHM